MAMEIDDYGLFSVVSAEAALEALNHTVVVPPPAPAPASATTGTDTTETTEAAKAEAEGEEKKKPSEAEGEKPKADSEQSEQAKKEAEKEKKPDPPKKVQIIKPLKLKVTPLGIPIMRDEIVDSIRMRFEFWTTGFSLIINAGVD